MTTKQMHFANLNKKKEERHNFNAPLLSQLPVFLLVCCGQPEQLLQMAPVSFHILVIDIDVIQLLFLLKDLLRGAFKHIMWENMSI